MYSKNGTIFSDAYKYLRNTENGTISLSSTESEEVLEEIEISLPITANNIFGNVYSYADKFCIIVEDEDYGKIKSSIVKLRYSNDDQIAIMLNSEESEEKELEYKRMQEWREFSSDVAKAIVDAIKTN